MIALLTILGLVKTFASGLSLKTYLILGAVLLVAIVLITGLVLHQRAVHNAIAKAGQEAALGERLQWQEQQRRAELARDQERRNAEARIHALETEAALLGSRIEAQEADLEAAIKLSENPPSGPTDLPPGPGHVLPRGLVRALSQQGR